MRLSFRSKLLLLFVGLALVTNGISVSLLYLRARSDLFGQMNSTALSIASSLASQVDTAKHQTVRTRADEETSAFRELEAQFRAVRDANRRQDVYVKFVYSFRPPDNGTGAPLFVVDAEEEGDDKSHAGDVYRFKDMDKYPPDFENPQVLPVLVEDQWGVWLTATSPIRDAAGRSVGAVGVDISAAGVMRGLRSLLLAGLLSLVASLVLAVVLSIILSQRVTRPLAAIRDAAAAVGEGRLETQVDIRTQDEFAEVGRAMNDMVVGLRQRDNLKATLVRYVSQEVADQILASGHVPDLKTERRKVTLLFADMRGFTSLSEKMNPEEIVLLLNTYFDRMIETVFRHRGYLNKFIGDGLMAVFGAPVDDVFQEEHAIDAALEMQREVARLQEEFRKERDLDLRIGIGINTGMAVVGNIGSQQKMEYTAIGDTVNTASRLEGKTKELGVGILVSEYTYVTVRHLFDFRKVGTVQVKGKTDALQVFTLTGRTEGGRTS